MLRPELNEVAGHMVRPLKFIYSSVRDCVYDVRLLEITQPLHLSALIYSPV